MSNSNLIDTAIKLITELLEIREKIFKIYLERKNSKEAAALTFRIKNYSKWLDKLNSLKDAKIELNTVDDIKAQKFTSKLHENMADILETGKLAELDEANNELAKMIDNVNPLDSVNTGTTATTTTVKKVVKKVKKVAAVAVAVATDESDKQAQERTEVDIKNLQAIPKNLGDVQRPTDIEGAALYDLQLVHGIGKSAAEKLRKRGISLELLLEDWRNFVETDESNSILMYSKMPHPAEINERVWNKKSDSDKENIQSVALKNLLESQTHYLHELTYEQLVGIKHFYNIRAERIPRSEVELNVIVLQESIKKFNPDMIATICGSYRRGRPTSGDIDCLITHPTYTTEFIESLGDKTDSGILTGFVNKLTKSGYLVDHLTPGGKKYYKGIAEIAGISACPRRIDIKLVPFDCYGAALLHATGSMKFNTDLRTYALSKGYTLNEYGLYKYSHGKKGELVNSKTEEDIFKILGYPYKSPQERDI